MIHQWEALLEESEASWRLRPGGKWDFFIFNNYYPQSSNILVLWYRDRGKFPGVVTKLSREEDALKREFQNLSHLHSQAATAKWGPRPLVLAKQGDFWGLWMEGVAGAVLLPQEYLPAKLHAAVEMLVSMHRAFRSQGGTDGVERYRRLVTVPLGTVTQFGQERSVISGCAELEARISPEWLASLPVIPQHGDLFAGNVLANGERCAAVDWENFATIDLPFYDLLTLLLSLLTPEGESPERWNPELKNQIPGLIAEYARKVGLDAADFSLLLPLTIANWLHLHWCDRRKAFTERMYKLIGCYFEHPDDWLQVFRQAGP
jgi:Ser/Thr protein kinase RdoA (MazF antagonist)